MQNDFKEILKIFKLDEQKKKKKVDWIIIRQIIGKPRRFSPYFLQKEKEKLDNYRKVLRNFLANPQIKLDIKNPKLIQEAIKLNPFTVGQIVLAIHPICNHFHNGSIFTTTHTQVIVKFFNELGVHKINDSCIAIDSTQEDQQQEINQQHKLKQQSSTLLHQQSSSSANAASQYQNQTLIPTINSIEKNFNINQPIFRKKSDAKNLSIQNALQYQQSSQSSQYQYQQQQQQSQQQEQLQTSMNFAQNQYNLITSSNNAHNSKDQQSVSMSKSSIVQDLDYFAMAFLIKVLERKTALINELRNFNNLVEQNPEISNERFFQEYGWAGVHINLLDNALKHINAKFRLRGIKNYKDLGQICQNFEKILTNPLKDFVEKEMELENTTEQNQETLKELKSIINKIIEEKISSQINEMMSQYLKNLATKEEGGSTPSAKNLNNSQNSNEEIKESTTVCHTKNSNLNQEDKQDKTLFPEQNSLLIEKSQLKQEQSQKEGEKEDEEQLKKKEETILKTEDDQLQQLDRENQEEKVKDTIVRRDTIENEFQKQKLSENNKNSITDINENKMYDEDEEQREQSKKQQQSLENENVQLEEEQLESNNVQSSSKIQQQKLLINELVKDDIDLQKTEELKSLVYNCLGVLCTLKQSGEINITENRFIKVLYNTTYEKNYEKFHEINSALLTITNSKNSDMLLESINNNSNNNNQNNNSNNNNNNNLQQKAQKV